MLITSDPKEAQALIEKYCLKPVKITSVEKTTSKSVYDVALQDDDVDLPKSIITNDIVTHNSQEPQYLEQILLAQGVKVPVEQIFGLRNPQTSQWAVKPRVRLYNESLAEKFFDSMAKLQRFLPDKVKVGDEWFYVYAHTKENISLLKGKYDKDYYQKTGKMRVPAENSLPQAILIVDSYPSMLPEGQDVDDPGSAMAMQARMFSEQIKRVKGKMKSKRITVVGMNQLRDKPMVMYGCNHADNILTFEDGSTYTIKEVVDGRLKGNVLSYSEDYQTLEYRQIIGWHYNGEVQSSKDWVRIETVDGAELVLTKNHEVLTTKGWVQAIDLKLSHRLYGNTTFNFEKPKYVQIKSLTVGYDELSIDTGKYDITVQGNHNYITGNTVGGVIVHNSPTYEPGGQALKFFCMSANSLVQTDVGLLYADEVTKDNLPRVLGDSGLEQPNVFDSFGISPIIEVETQYGFTVKGKPTHRVRAYYEKEPLWRELQHLTIYDSLEIRVGDNIFPITEKVCESINDARYSSRECVLAFLNFHYPPGKTHTFDNEREAEVYQLILLNLGHVCSRKQKVVDASNVIDYSVPEFFGALKSNVISIKETEPQMTYDFNMPDTHTVVTNGIISHNSDCRIQLSSRANPHGKGQIDEEPSYDNRGTDKYRYIHTKATKNKLSTPYLEGMMRVWIEDSDGKARGIDTVWDTWSYLLMTGQIEGKRNKFRILFKEWPEMKPISWQNFKTFILGTKKEQVELFEKYGLKPINIRKYCQKQLSEGNGIEMYFDHIKRGGNKQEDDD